MSNKRMLLWKVVLCSLSLAILGNAPLLQAQTKPADTQKADAKKLDLRDDWPTVKGTMAKIVKVDAKKRMVYVQYADGKKAELILGKDVKFMGPRQGKAESDDERFAEGRTIKIVFEGNTKSVKEIHLQILKESDKEKK